MAAPWTRPTRASEKAGMIIEPTSAKLGSCKPGSALGTVATPLSSATSAPMKGAASNAASPDPAMTATTMASAPSLVRSSRSTSAIVTAPTRQAGRLNCRKLANVSKARTMRLGPWLS